MAEEDGWTESVKQIEAGCDWSSYADLKQTKPSRTWGVGDKPIGGIHIESVRQTGWYVRVTWKRSRRLTILLKEPYYHVEWLPVFSLVRARNFQYFQIYKFPNLSFLVGWRFIFGIWDQGSGRFFQEFSDFGIMKWNERKQTSVILLDFVDLLW